jgi:hypothetical protein
MCQPDPQRITIPSNGNTISDGNTASTNAHAN